VTGTVVGHFRDRASADAAYDELGRRGFRRDAISIVERRADGAAAARDEPVTAGEGAAVGGIAGVLIGVGAMLIPGVGPILAAGPIAAALAGALTGGVTGAVTGGLAGALVDAGVDEDAARYYDELVREGGVLVTVSADDGNLALARDVLERHGGDLRAAASVGDARSRDLSQRDGPDPSDRNLQQRDLAGGGPAVRPRAADAGSTAPPQSYGTDPGAVGDPEPRALIGDDPGVVDTPYRTNTGMTGFDVPARPTTPPPPDPVAPPPAPAPEPRRRGPPII
jgi:uncharacterized membrane protein